LYSDDPTYISLTNFPLPPILQPVLHSLWDGGLFLAGLALVWLLCPPPHLQCFSWKELFVLLVWGQVQELAVELAATSAGAWTFTPRWWNPILFESGEGVITLAPQLIWFVAPIVFYLVALRVHRRTLHRRH
jgi:hypothetical protein